MRLSKSEPRSRSLAAVIAVLVALAAATLGLTTVGVDEAEAHAAVPKVQLSELRVKAAGSMTGYSRDLFPHWSDAQDYGWTIPSFVAHPGSCDARDGALIRDGRGTENVGSYCDVNSGVWVDPYGGGRYTNPSDIDIDHVVPLANAWRSGAASWTTAKKERFANVPKDVLAVDDGLNASKGDKGPEAWKPPRAAYHCTYATKWIRIKHDWRLSVTSAEKSSLTSMLSTCPTR